MECEANSFMNTPFMHLHASRVLSQQLYGSGLRSLTGGAESGPARPAGGDDRVLQGSDRGLYLERDGPLPMLSCR